MKNLKIAFFETESWEEDYLKSRLKGFDFLFFKNELGTKDMEKLQDTAILSPFIYSKINKEHVDSLKNLRLITTRSTGYDHINIKACRENKIMVSNVPVYGVNTVAEHTFALILALSRKINISCEKTKKGDFSLDNLRGFDLKEKTIGIIGMGSIGQYVAKISKGFEMNVLAFDVKKDVKIAKKIGFKYVSFNSLLKNSDIVTLHSPYNPKTHHLIDIKTLDLFKKGCVLINTSRGGICNTTALLKGLKEGIFSGLGLDVLEEECFIKEERELLTDTFKKTCDLKTALENHILINQPNVIITPHNAFNSKEALTRILETTIENIKSFANNKPINLVK